ncbi:MAG: transglutaminase domain-containing protein [Bacteroidales bacterium]|nr:transglutaminase domain-containing protein [Bacteroidales bacterium]MBR5862695.1 transglutaminase domain-containing protein [Bacteroidales bacterium]
MKHFSCIILSALVLLTGCNSHFISDETFRQGVLEDLSARSEILAAAGVDLEAMDVRQQEKEALEFLYAYMPLGDIVNLEPSYYLDHYRLMRKALKEMPWGKSVPEREMRHFVLPVRVNNENLDSARYVFYEELAPRIKGMSMKDAVLEVNHWCHEKAVYMPSDRRTSSPLATIKTAYGRCGEESTLLVAALRSVGIPARQVYTPRWAHTDSNHAWVEAWVDGDWYFLGACEPEPVLNLGWFNAPASRGMLMHTNVFGKYNGPEEIVRETALYTEINVIEHYAPESAALQVTVVDKAGQPVEGAKVTFKIYNYSEFNSVAYKLTDAEGRTSLTAGLGDMMIHVSKGGRFGFRKVTYGKESEVTIALDYEKGSDIAHIDMEVVPPVENAQLPDVTDEQRAENTRRMEYEDSLRNAYVATFYTAQTGLEYAKTFEKKHFPDQDQRIADILVASRGNHTEITAFLHEADEKGVLVHAYQLLETLAQKDLRDTPKSVLDDHLYFDADGSLDHVVCPRVDTELLRPYREYFKTNIPASLADTVVNNTALFVKWCKENLTMHDGISLRYVQLDPKRVWETRLADKGSREIFFVAVCRSFNVEAWMDPVTRVVKYKGADGLVYDVDFDAVEQIVAPKGKLKLTYNEIPLLDDPKYEVHFSISKYVDGEFQLQNYDGSWAQLFRQPREMDCGYYMLVSGSRMSGGNVFADIEYFTIEEGETTVKELVMRDIADQIRVIGSFDSEMKYMSVTPGDAEARVGKSVLETTGRGYFAVALVDYGTEPTNHAFMDISAVKNELGAWGRPILVIFATEDDYRKFRAQDFDLPSTVHFGIDLNGQMRDMIATEMKLTKGGRLPLIVMADTFNRVVFFSQGYNIGLGESLVKTSKAL